MKLARMGTKFATSSPTVGSTVKAQELTGPLRIPLHPLLLFRAATLWSCARFCLTIVILMCRSLTAGRALISALVTAVCGNRSLVLSSNGLARLERARLQRPHAEH